MAETRIEELEERIAALWEEVLQRRVPDVHDNFFESGGDSVLLTRLHRQLNESVGAISLVELFQHPTIASMARRLAAADAPGPSERRGAPRPAGSRGGRAPGDALARQRRFMQRRRKRQRAARRPHTTIDEESHDGY